MKLTHEQIDFVLVEELQTAHDRFLEIDKDEGGFPIPPDWEFLEAIETVLKYYMGDREYQQWYTEAALKKMTLNTELNGEYDEPQA